MSVIDAYARDVFELSMYQPPETALSRFTEIHFKLYELLVSSCSTPDEEAVSLLLDMKWFVANKAQIYLDLTTSRWDRQLHTLFLEKYN